jgi:hypothetical protein
MSKILVWSAVSFLTLFIWSTVGFGQEKTETPQQRTERMLDQRVSLEVVKTPLAEVLKGFSTDLNVPIEFSPETQRGKAAVDPQAPVTYQLKQLSLRSVLHLLLDPHQLEPVVQENGTLLLVPGTAELRAKRVESEVQQVARAKLREKWKTAVSGTFTGTPWKDVLAFQAMNVDCPILIDPRALVAAGVSDEEPIYLSHGAIPLKDSLKRILLPLGLQAVIQDEVILIVQHEPPAKPVPAPEVDKALATKFDLDFVGPLHKLAVMLTDKTGVPFGICQLDLRAAGMTLNQKITIQAQGVTPAEALQLAKLPSPLKLIEHDGMVLITVEKGK